MNQTLKSRTGGEILVDALRINGVDRAFCVPGESYLSVLDALYDVQDEIELVVCRQEGGAAYMAEAYGKLTGKPGICFVTRGPGATNASVGVHTAYQDSTSMILFVGQVARDQRDREAFQEIDYRAMFGPMAKWVVQVDDARRLPELISQAFHRAINGRPGPVVVALPEDMLTDVVMVKDAGPAQQFEPHANGKELESLAHLLDEAERPLLILGGGGWNEQAVAHIAQFVEAQDLPVVASFRCQDLFDNRHPNYAGDLGFAAGPALVQAMKNADLLLVVGARLGEVSTCGYTTVEIPTPQQKIVHVHQGIEELGRVYQPSVGINSSMPSFALKASALPRMNKARNTSWRAELNKKYRENLAIIRSPGDVQMAEIISELNQQLPEDAILTNGAGNYAIWLQRFYQYRKFRTQLGPTNGSMGYGVPAAIAAKLTHPERQVIAFAGDGCFLMNGQEIATAAHYGVSVIFIVVNNSMYGTIRMHQERNFPGRVCGTALHNPDFAALGRAYGLHAETVVRTDDFPHAFARCIKAGSPSLIEIRVAQEAITPGQSLQEIRDESLKKQL